MHERLNRDLRAASPVRGFMNDALKTQISAFVDGELPDNESELLLRRLSQDTALRAQVAQYLAIGRLIRQDVEVPGMDGLRDRIAAALGDDQVPAHEEQRVVGSKFMTPVTGVAVAATVAALALVGLSQLDAPQGPDLDSAVAIVTAPSYTEPEVLGNQPDAQSLEYFRRHDNSSSDLGTNATLTRMVTFELREGELVEIEPDSHLQPVTPDDDVKDSSEKEQ
jgi:sigma-E factor negative regulatory protein RseA